MHDYNTNSHTHVHTNTWIQHSPPIMNDETEA